MEKQKNGRVAKLNPTRISENLLKDTTGKVLTSLKDQCDERPDLLPLLFAFFKVNDKLQTLFDWAIRMEVENSARISELFRLDGVTTKLFNCQFYDTLGHVYLRDLLKPFILEIVNSKDSLTIDSSHPNHLMETKENIEFLLEMAERFLLILSKNLHKLPISHRTLLWNMYNHLTLKIGKENAEQIVASVFFLRFICPAFVSPVKFGLLTEELTPNEQKLLILLSKYLQHVAFPIELEAHIPNAERLNQFISKVSSILQNFIRKVVNIEEINYLDEVVQANVVTDVNKKNEQKKNAEQNLIYFLKTYDIGISLETNRTFPEEKAKLFRLYLARDWKEVSYSKKCGITVYTRKEENPYEVYKVRAKFAVNMEFMYTFLQDYQNLLKRDESILNCECIEQIDILHSDWYIQQRAPFPQTPRDYVIARYGQYNDKRSIFLEFSVSRQDKPEFKKCVRGQIDASGYVIDAEEDLNVVTVTYILQVCTFGANCYSVNSLQRYFRSVFKNIQKQISRKLRKSASQHNEVIIPVEETNPRRLRRTSSDPGERERSASILLKNQPEFPPVFWSEGDVKQWLVQLGVSKEAQNIFYQDKVNGSYLLEMTSEEIGSKASSFEDRVKIMKEIQKLKQSDAAILEIAN